ncbi:SagB family peptide dehydrogenase [Halosquirtibacter xylanolyticus]|uniref:SagB family peptide dehydrogenase n=1 Tax=Halosquirtibacter xylanolyticus TaxID=3374599 RepID=UPI003748E592|nr:SagB family peptide dehydrogenase [Prolixibacteraceae bacterium]
MNIKEIRNRYQEKDGGMYGKRNIENSLAMLYHENSKFTTYSARIEGQKIMGFNNEFVNKRAYQPYKCYPNTTRIDLNDYKNTPLKKDLISVLNQRRSVRQYNDTYKISLSEITTLLYNSYGVSNQQKLNNVGRDAHMGLRNVPSGGGLFPLEAYLVIQNAHIPSGLYHYRSDINQLECLKEGDFKQDLANIIQAEPYVQIKDASMVVLLTGVVERSIIKYGERGYRFMLQESGEVAQTLSILGEALDLGSCILGGYLDDKVNSFIGIDGVFESINNVIVFGGKTK